MLGARPVIKIRDVVIKNGEKTVFEGLNYDLFDAEFCYIIGGSGSGKTTFLKALYGELPITQGIAQLLDYDLTKMDRKTRPQLRRKIGMIFQDFKLFPSWTVEENLDFVLKATDWKDANTRNQRIQEVLSQVNLSEKIHDPVYKLSGGEQQRVAVSRSILNRPALLIADEPTGNLDPESADQVMRLIRMLATESKMAVIFATHDQRIINKFPARQFVCDQGRLVELSS